MKLSNLCFLLVALAIIHNLYKIFSGYQYEVLEVAIQLGCIIAITLLGLKSRKKEQRKEN